MHIYRYRLIHYKGVSMKSILFIITILTSTSIFAAAMGDYKKLQAADLIVKESRKLKGFTLHKSELEFSNYSFRYAIPLFGQIDALFDYAGEGDQDVEGYRAELSNGKYDYELTCVIKSERKKHVNEQLVEDGVEYTVSLERCDLENIQTGNTEDIGYLFFESWVERDNDPSKTDKAAILDGSEAFPKDSYGAGAGYGGYVPSAVSN